MSTFSVERLPGEPILLHIMTAEFSGRDAGDSNNAVRAALDAAEEPLFLVSDFSRLNFSLSDIIFAASAGARGENAPLHHPMIRELVVATDKQFMQMAVKGLNSDVFGNVNVKVFGTLDEALAYCRS